MRESGLPISEEDINSFRLEFKESYDVLYAQFEEKKITMEELQASLNDVETDLNSRFIKRELITLPKSGKQWKDLQIKYASPILTAVEQESNKLILILMDAGYQ